MTDAAPAPDTTPFARNLWEAAHDIGPYFLIVIGIASFAIGALVPALPTQVGVALIASGLTKLKT